MRECLCELVFLRLNSSIPEFRVFCVRSECFLRSRRLFFLCVFDRCNSPNHIYKPSCAHTRCLADKLPLQLGFTIDQFPLPFFVLFAGYPPRRLEFWQFLLYHLLSGNHTHLLVWVSQRKGQFRIRDPRGLANLWGKYRSSSSMTYGKMSRVLRYYYPRQIMERSYVRLVYVFSEKIMREVSRVELQATVQEKRKVVKNV